MPNWFSKILPIRRLHSSRSGSRRHREVRREDTKGEWSPIQWKLVWLVDGFVLRRRGIRPRFKTREADEAWEMYMVDPAMAHNPRDFQRVVLASMVAEGEAFVQKMDGKFMPVPCPSDIKYDVNNIPEFYIWFHPAKRVPADEIIHLFVRVRPGQKRGDNLFATVRPIAEERYSYIRSLAKLAKMAARLWLFQKRKGGNRIISAETNADSREVQPEQSEIDFEQDGITQIGPEDEIVAPSVSGQPVEPVQVDKIIGRTLAMPFGVSSMQLMGDFSETNYSSARFADLTDQTVWTRYQDLLWRITRELYMQWPERGRYEEYFVQWYVPPFPSIDPVKTQAANKMMLADKTKAPQEVILEDDRDPETTFAMIEEFQRRFGMKGEGNNSAQGQDNHAQNLGTNGNHVGHLWDNGLQDARRN